MATEPAQISFLVSALLAVNFYTVDRAYSLMPAFGERGLLDPKRVAAMSHDELNAAMVAAGYNRGGFVPILSYRLAALMDAVAGGSLATLGGLAIAGKKEAFIATLSAVEGFGPRTAETAWELFRDAVG